MNPTPVIHCPYCGTANAYAATACLKCGKDISSVARPPIPHPEQLAPVSAVDTVKFSTVILLVLAVILFFTTIIGGIICGVIAYFSYKSPNKSWPF